MIINALLILIALLLFGLIIFVHEFGHFITAKLSGIRVNEFAIGMGPTLFQFQRGETQYSLRLLPIGGYCAMEGEDESSDDARAFNNKPVWKRIIVVCAGAVMNILLGIILMMVVLAQQPAFSSTTIVQFAENSALQNAGLQVGDQFYSVNGYRVFTDRDLSFSLATANPQSLDVVIVREGEKLNFNSIAMNTRDNGGKQAMVLDFYVAAIDKNPITLVQKSASDTVSVARMVWYSLVGLVTGQYSMNDMAGPVGAADAISQAASIGLKQGILPAVNNIIMMMTMITVNLGIVNLLPLPALDGGRLIFLLIELVRRRPINPKYEGWVHAAGFTLLMVFMVIVTYSDILRLFTGKGLGG